MEEMRVNNEATLPPVTTAEEERTLLGQRTISKLWEDTQASVAKYSILGALIIDGLAILISIILNRDFTAAQALSLGVVNGNALAVISFYFSRTNHSNIGGIGLKPLPPYDRR